MVITIAFLSLAGFSLYRSRIHTEQRAFTSASNVAKILAQSVQDTIEKIDIVLVDAKDEIEQRISRPHVDPAELDRILSARLSTLPELQSLRMADRNGQFLYGIPETEGRGKNIRDREYFLRLERDPGAGLVISDPIVSRIHGKWLLVFARRINLPGGGFGGVVTGSFRIDSFSTLFSTVDIGTHGGISLRDGNMGIIARHPAPKDIGSIIGNKKMSPELKWYFETGKESGTFYTSTSWDNVAKVVSFRKIKGFPLYINVGIAAEDYLPEWRRDLLKVLLLTAIYILVVLGFAWSLHRTMQQEKKWADEAQARTNLELQRAITTIKTLEGILPICSSCKKIRDKEGRWTQFEAYITQHSEALFSHGYCPECAKVLLGQVEALKRAQSSPES